MYSASRTEYAVCTASPPPSRSTTMTRIKLISPCREKVLIIEMKTELAELKRQKAEGTASQPEPEKGMKKDQKKAKKVK